MATVKKVSPMSLNKKGKPKTMSMGGGMSNQMPMKKKKRMGKEEMPMKGKKGMKMKYGKDKKMM